MVSVMSDKGHMRGEWDEVNMDLKVRDGSRITIYHFDKDGTVTARDIWEKKKVKKSA